MTTFTLKVSPTPEEGFLRLVLLTRSGRSPHRPGRQADGLTSAIRTYFDG
jgi:hypothetical protein